MSEKGSIFQTQNAVAWAVIDVATEELIDVLIVRPGDDPAGQVRYEPLFFGARSSSTAAVCDPDV